MTWSTVINGQTLYSARYVCSGCGNYFDMGSASSGSFPGSTPHTYLNCSLSGSVLTCGLMEGWQCGLENTKTLSCSFDEGEFECGISENDTVSLCSKIIVSLVPTNQMQFLLKGSPLVTTARVTYLDGSEKTVMCIADKDTSVAGENLLVTLSTPGYLSATKQGQAACKIRVTILE